MLLRHAFLKSINDNVHFPPTLVSSRNWRNRGSRSQTLINLATHRSTKNLYPRSYRFSLVQKKKKKKLHKEARVEGEKMKRKEGNEGGGNKVCQNSVAFQLLFSSAFLPKLSLELKFEMNL